MGKIVFIFLCFFIVLVWSAAQGSSSNLTEVEVHFQNRIEELTKFHKEFKEFRASLFELSSAFVHFRQSLTSNGSAGETTETGGAGETGESGTLENPDPGLITSCSVAMEFLPAPQSKKQTIYPYGNNTSLEVLCDFETNVDGGGWTIIQKRSSGPQQEFHRNWTEYSNGFGSLDGNFWLGLNNIHALTKNGDQELRIELEDFHGEKAWAKYANFSISSASDDYRLSLSGFSPHSMAGDSMTTSILDGVFMLNKMKFSTWDRDNDKVTDMNCAAARGGWWHNFCSLSSLNGLYVDFEYAADGIFWSMWKLEVSMAKAEMKIRKKNIRIKFGIENRSKITHTFIFISKKKTISVYSGFFGFNCSTFN